MSDPLIVIRGGGDLGSGVALRLWRVGFQIVVLESPEPVAVRRTVALSQAVYDGRSQVEELQGRLAGSVAEVREIANGGEATVLIDPEGILLAELGPYALVDAIMAKRNMGTRKDMAPMVAALGPGFYASRDVHAVVETNRGPNLGRVIWHGEAESDTGEPAPVLGHGSGRVLRAPASGALEAMVGIGERVREGDVVATVEGKQIRAPFTGMVRGLARDGIQVTQGMKIGDIDPRFDPHLCRLVSDKSLAVAGGVLEAVLMSLGENRP